ncbi:MAG: hypothetical protein IPM69_19865 [Ignavibacteria bacterium]|nr:hypothetical protein [Ignavibacteria bacterium]
MPIPNEIPDSLRIKLDKGVIDNLLISEDELDSLLHSYPESDYLLARKINLLLEDRANIPDVEKLIKSIHNPGTFILSEVGCYYATYLFNFQTAIKKLDESISIDKRRINWLCRMNYAEIIANGRYFGVDNGLELSDKYFNEALEISPDNPRVLLAWARISVLHNTEDYMFLDRASNLLSLIPVDYDPSRRYSVEGALWITKNSPTKAKFYLQKAIEMDSNFLEPVTFLADLENQLGNYQIVERLLKPVIIKNPNIHSILNSYIEALLNLKKFKDAVKYCEHLLNIDTNQIPSSLNLIKIAEAYIGLAEYKKAEESLNKAQKLSPSVEAEVLLMVVHWLKHKDIKNEIINFFQQHPGDFSMRHVRSVFDKYGVKIK